MQWFVLFEILAIAAPAFANDPCASGCGVQALRDLRAITHNAGYFENVDERRNDDEYAAINSTDPNRFAATGRIVCRDPKTKKEHSTATAQITIKQNLITTSAHTFQSATKPCKEAWTIDQCKFRIKTHGQERDIKLEKKMKDGFEGASCPPNLVDDWAILKLAEKVDVDPYQTDPAEIQKLRKGSEVVYSGFSVDWRERKVVGGKEVIGDFVQHVGNCRIKDPIGAPVFAFHTTCAGSWHSSGGGTFTKNTKKPILLAIHSGSSLTRAEHEREEATAEPTRSPGGYSEVIPIDGDFYSALTFAAGQL